MRSLRKAAVAALVRACPSSLRTREDVPSRGGGFCSTDRLGDREQVRGRKSKPCPYARTGQARFLFALKGAAIPEKHDTFSGPAAPDQRKAAIGPFPIAASSCTDQKFTRRPRVKRRPDFSFMVGNEGSIV